MELMRFDAAWASLLSWLEVSEKEAWPLRGEVLTQYRQPDPAYHTLSHALRVLADVKKFSHWWGVDDYGAVQLAALLHDVVYDTRSAENEAKSAEFTVWWGQALGIAPIVYTQAAEIIRATQSHAPSDSADTRPVLDADLLILAAPRSGTRPTGDQSGASTVGCRNPTGILDAAAFWRAFWSAIKSTRRQSCRPPWKPRHGPISSASCPVCRSEKAGGTS